LPIFFFFLFSLWQERSGGDRYGRATKSGSNVIDKRFHATNATAIALSQSSTVAFASLTNIRPTAYITSPNTQHTQLQNCYRHHTHLHTQAHTHALQSTRKNWRRVEKIKAVQLSVTKAWEPRRWHGA